MSLKPDYFVSPGFFALGTFSAHSVCLEEKRDKKVAAQQYAAISSMNSDIPRTAIDLFSLDGLFSHHRPRDIL